MGKNYREITEKYSGNTFFVIFRYFFPHFRGLGRGEEFCNFSPIFRGFPRWGLPGLCKGKNNSQNQRTQNDYPENPSALKKCYGAHIFRLLLRPSFLTTCNVFLLQSFGKQAFLSTLCSVFLRYQIWLRVPNLLSVATLFSTGSALVPSRTLSLLNNYRWFVFCDYRTDLLLESIKALSW